MSQDLGQSTHLLILFFFSHLLVLEDPVHTEMSIPENEPSLALSVLSPGSQAFARVLSSMLLAPAPGEGWLREIAQDFSAISYTARTRTQG